MVLISLLNFRVLFYSVFGGVVSRSEMLGYIELFFLLLPYRYRLLLV